MGSVIAKLTSVLSWLRLFDRVENHKSNQFLLGIGKAGTLIDVESSMRQLKVLCGVFQDMGSSN